MVGLLIKQIQPFDELAKLLLQCRSIFPFPIILNESRDATGLHIPGALKNSFNTKLSVVFSISLKTSTCFRMFRH